MSLSFEFSREQEELRTRMRAFALERLLPGAHHRAQADELPWDAIREMAELGFMGFTFPRELGGHEGSWVDFSIALEEVGRGDLSCGWISLMENSYPKILDDEEIIRGVCRGDAIVAFAETEPQSGGDAAAIETAARRDGGDYVIDGFKTYVSLVPGANVLLVTAMTTPGAARKGMSMFVVPADAPGVTVEALPEPGVKAHMLGSISFDGVRVPADALVGEEDRGFYLMRERWDYTRGAAGATLLIGAALQSLDETVERAKQKRTFGKPLLNWQSVQFKLVDHYTRLEAARLLAYEASWRADQGLPVTRHASMLKTYVAEVCFPALKDCLEIWGGRGFREDAPVLRRILDHLGWELAGGGTDIHKIVLGSELFGREHAVHR